MPSNWKTFDAESMDFCQGITLHHLPGHTDGLVGMQLNMLDSGTWFFVSDHAHVAENVSVPIPRRRSQQHHVCRSALTIPVAG